MSRFLANAVHSAQSRDARYDVAINALIDLEGSSVSARSENLSVSGAKLRLPFLAEMYEIEQITGIRFDGLGYLSAKLVWSSGPCVGVVFTGAAKSRVQVSNFLEAQGLRSVD